MAQNIKKRRDRRSSSNPLDKLFSFLALMAVLFNFLAPVTHGFMASAETGEYVQMCTKNGIELRLVPSAQNEDSSATIHADCNTCPLCQIGKTQALSAPKMQVFESQYSFFAPSGLNFVDEVSYLQFNKYDLAPRAPPAA
ncbi:MAG: DUF2946 domain-containing protein [Sneathiella sp.]